MSNGLSMSKWLKGAHVNSVALIDKCPVTIGPGYARLSSRYSCIAVTRATHNDAQSSIV